MNDQQSLFNRPAPAAHASPTSNAAARAMDKTGKHRSIKERVLGVLDLKWRYKQDGMTDEEIAKLVGGCRYTSIVSARNSLCNMRPPLVEHSGRVRKSKTTGMRATVWRVTS